jgi:hypothetical protein
MKQEYHLSVPVRAQTCPRMPTVFSMDDLGHDKSFKWRYDLEEERFICRIISMAQAVHLWDGQKITYEDLLRDNPHRAYVIAIEYRALIIVDRFKSLNILDRMLAYEGFPIKTAEGAIFRDQWIRIIRDVLLSRLTLIRDCCFLLVAEIYELGLAPRNVSLSILKKLITDGAVVDLLNTIAQSARNIRDERDQYLHRGEQRTLSGEMDQFFQIMAMTEGSHISTPKLGFFDDEKGNQPIEINLREIHETIVRETLTEYHRDGDQLLTLTRELFDLIEPEFNRRWADKRKIAKDIRGWEIDQQANTQTAPAD